MLSGKNILLYASSRVSSTGIIPKTKTPQSGGVFAGFGHSRLLKFVQQFLEALEKLVDLQFDLIDFGLDIRVFFLADPAVGDAACAGQATVGWLGHQSRAALFARALDRFSRFGASNNLGLATTGRTNPVNVLTDNAIGGCCLKVRRFGSALIGHSLRGNGIGIAGSRSVAAILAGLVAGGCFGSAAAGPAAAGHFGRGTVGSPADIQIICLASGVRIRCLSADSPGIAITGFVSQFGAILGTCLIDIAAVRWAITGVLATITLAVAANRVNLAGIVGTAANCGSDTRTCVLPRPIRILCQPRFVDADVTGRVVIDAIRIKFTGLIRFSAAIGSAVACIFTLFACLIATLVADIRDNGGTGRSRCAGEDIFLQVLAASRVVVIERLSLFFAC